MYGHLSRAERWCAWTQASLEIHSAHKAYSGHTSAMVRLWIAAHCRAQHLTPCFTLAPRASGIERHAPTAVLPPSAPHSSAYLVSHDTALSEEGDH
jgi:hypothetical protein